MENMMILGGYIILLICNIVQLKKARNKAKKFEEERKKWGKERMALIAIYKVLEKDGC